MTVAEKRIWLKEKLLSGKSLAVPGVYDALSARVAESAGYEAVYLGSYATAASLLGLPDAGNVTMNEMCFHAKNVANAVNLPLICDAEGGFFNAANIGRTVSEFEAAGVAAIHIEDHIFGKHTKLNPQICDIDTMCGKIRAACDARKDKDFLIFARTDVAWATGDIDDVVKRANNYLQAGADAVFLAGFPAKYCERSVRERVNGPVVKTGSAGVSFAAEEKMGANIVLYWPMMLYAALIACREVSELFLETKDHSKLGKYTFNEPDFNRSIPFDEFLERVEKYMK